MGELGEVLPKPLWPVFELTLFELSLKQLKELGVERCYTNLYHCSERIEKYLVSHNLDVEVLLEPELLGSGGAFHNLKKIRDEQRVLAINSDSLYLFDSTVKQEIEASKKTKQHLLVGQKVQKEGGYNEWETRDGRLIGILGPSTKQSYWTFSGVSSINLDQIRPVHGNSSFFKTVANPVEKMTRVIEKEFPIYDYGTLQHYENSIWTTFHDEKLRKKLMALGALAENRLDLSRLSYASQHKGVLNFTSSSLEFFKPGIYIQLEDKTYRVWQGRVTQVGFELA